MHARTVILSVYFWSTSWKFFMGTYQEIGPGKGGTDKTTYFFAFLMRTAFFRDRHYNQWPPLNSLQHKFSSRGKLFVNGVFLSSAKVRKNYASPHNAFPNGGLLINLLPFNPLRSLL